MNKKRFLSVVFLLFFSLTGSVVLAGHKNTLTANAHRALLRAQVAQPVASATSPKKKKKKSEVAVEIDRLRQAYYKEREDDQLDWEGGPPEPDEVQVHINIVNRYSNFLRSLIPETKKDKKAHNRFFNELTQEAKNLSEALVQSENDDLHEANRIAYDMEEDCWGDASTCTAKIQEFERVVALWQTFQTKVANLGHKRLAREAMHEAKQMQENIQNIKDNLANAQREQNQQFEPAFLPQESVSVSETPNVFRQLTEMQGFDDIVKNLYAANTPTVCANVSFDDCSSVMITIVRSGGDLMPFANLIIQAARQIGRNDVTSEQIIEELQRAAQQQASAYQALRRRVRAR